MVTQGTQKGSYDPARYIESPIIAVYINQVDPAFKTWLAFKKTEE